MCMHACMHADDIFKLTINLATICIYIVVQLAELVLKFTVTYIATYVDDYVYYNYTSLHLCWNDVGC